MSNKVEEELRNLATLWILVVASLCYCHFIGKIIKHGVTRLVLIIPVTVLFFLLPLTLRAIVLEGLISFFIAWLANFKLLLFSFGEGPLSSDPPHSLVRFISLASFPIKLQDNPTNSSTRIDDDQNYPVLEEPVKKKAQKPLLGYLVKAVMLSTIFFTFENKNYLHPKFYSVIYCFYIYTSLEMILAIVAATARAYLRVELEPQFNKPHLATSIQDFWGRRWNIMVSKVLRPAVYVPVRAVSKHVVGDQWATIPAVVATFTVSGIMHEWIIYVIGRSKPTWEMMHFFVLHGVCMALEITVKRRTRGKWRLPPLLSCPITVSFVIVTAIWLFLPAMMRCNSDAMVHREIVAIFRYVKTLGARLGITEKGSNSTVFSSLHNRIT